MRPNRPSDCVCIVVCGAFLNNASALPDYSHRASALARDVVAVAIGDDPNVCALRHGGTVERGIPYEVGIVAAEDLTTSPVVDVDMEVGECRGGFDAEEAELFGVAIGNDDVGYPEDVVFVIGFGLRRIGFYGFYRRLGNKECEIGVEGFCHIVFRLLLVDVLNRGGCTCSGWLRSL